MADLDVKEIEQAFPQGKEVTINGKLITIKPFGFGQFPKVLTLFKGFKLPTKAEANKEDYNIFDLLMENADKVVQLVSLATKIPLQQLDDTDPTEGIKAAMVILEVNRDFFTVKLLPELVTMLTNLNELVGAASLPPSLKTGTP